MLTPEPDPKFPSVANIDAMLAANKHRRQELLAMRRLAIKMADWLAERPIIDRSGVLPSGEASLDPSSKQIRDEATLTSG